jgi:hypothetical protein
MRAGIITSRVVIHATKTSDKLMTTEVRFGVAAQTLHQP